MWTNPLPALFLGVSSLAWAQGVGTAGGLKDTGPPPNLVNPKLLRMNPASASTCKAVQSQQVLAEFTISKEGIPTDIKIPQLPPAVQICAMQVITGLRYIPGTNNGEPIAVRVHLTINLGNSEPSQETPKQ